MSNGLPGPKEALPRVFEDDLGPWPEVYSLNPGYLVRAWHYSPKSANRTGWANVLIMIPTLILGFAGMLWAGMGFWLSVLFTVFLFMVVGLCLDQSLKPLLCEKLSVRFVDGQVEVWNGDTLFQTVSARMGRVFVADSHREAEAEQREEHRKVRRNRNQPLSPQELPRIYRDASEVIVRFGPAGMRNVTVAEILNDPHGEKADRLRSTLEFVDEEAAREGAPEPQDFINAVRGTRLSGDRSLD